MSALRNDNFTKPKPRDYQIYNPLANQFNSGSARQANVIKAQNKHQSAYYNNAQHPMNVWLYPKQIQQIQYNQFEEMMLRQGNQMQMNVPATSQQIQPKNRDGNVSIVAADFTEEGRLQFQNGDLYQGEFANGKMEGKGVLRTLAGDVYEGMFKNGFKHGKGKITYANGIASYEGDWHYNKIEGEGVSVDELGNRYEGRFLGNMRNGYGKCEYANRSRFQGIWQNNLPLKGSYILEDGTLFDGDWKDDMFSGVGTITYPNGDAYQGEWKEN